MRNDCSADKISLAIDDFHNPEQWYQPADQLYCEILDQIMWGENNGFDDVWLSEHHVIINDDYLRSILPAAAAIATRTNRIHCASGMLVSLDGKIYTYDVVLIKEMYEFILETELILFRSPFCSLFWDEIGIRHWGSKQSPDANRKGDRHEEHRR